MARTSIPVSANHITGYLNHISYSAKVWQGKLWWIKHKQNFDEQNFDKFIVGFIGETLRGRLFVKFVKVFHHQTFVPYGSSSVFISIIWQERSVLYWLNVDEVCTRSQLCGSSGTCLDCCQEFKSLLAWDLFYIQ